MGNKRVPEVRFDGFSGEWEKEKLGNLYNVYSGQTPLRSDPSNFDSPNTPWVKTTDLNNSAITVNEENISEKAAKKLKVLKCDTVLIAMYGGFNQIGRTGLLTYPATINQAISALEPNDNVVPYFLLTELNFRVREWQRLAASSRKDPNITKRDVESFIFKLPSYDEQIKIGYLFKQLDDMIAIHQQELNTLKRTKQGFLQKMFPKEGEAVPEIRFPGFSGDWTRYKLEEVANYRRGSFPQPYGNKEWYNEENGMPFVQVVDVDKNLKLVDDTKQKISKLAQPKSVFVEPETVIITLQGSIGRVAITQYPSYVDRTLLIFENYKISMNKYYFAYVIQQLFEREKQRAPGGTIKTITIKALSNFLISLPNIEEQTKIGKFFKQLDDTIALHEQELETLKQTKKAFLQKMFV